MGNIRTGIRLLYFPLLSSFQHSWAWKGCIFPLLPLYFIFLLDSSQGLLEDKSLLYTLERLWVLIPLGSVTDLSEEVGIIKKTIS